MLNYGQSLFEGMKAQRSAKGNILLFRPEENAARLQAGIASLLPFLSSRSWLTNHQWHLTRLVPCRLPQGVVHFLPRTSATLSCHTWFSLTPHTHPAE